MAWSRKNYAEDNQKREGGYKYGAQPKIQDETGYWYEVLEEIFVKQFSPSIWHQRVLLRIFCQLADFFDDFDP